jgi:solute carrier family 25 protein 16
MPTRADETNLRRFAAGAISGERSSGFFFVPGLLRRLCGIGTISVFFTYPLELIRVRMAFQTRNSNPSSPFKGTRPTFIQAMSYLYHEGTSPPASTHTPIPPSSTPPPPRAVATKKLLQHFPILKFYRGFTVSVAGMIPYAGTSFFVWGFLRSHFVPPREASSKARTPIADLTIGAIAGAISQTASYPFEIVRRRMQVGGLTRPDQWLGWSETVRNIWRANGWRGFYVGLGIGYLKVVPMTAVSFAVWQAGKHVLGV